MRWDFNIHLTTTLPRNLSVKKTSKIGQDLAELCLAHPVCKWGHPVNEDNGTSVASHVTCWMPAATPLSIGAPMRSITIAVCAVLKSRGRGRNVIHRTPHHSPAQAHLYLTLPPLYVMAVSVYAGVKVDRH